MGLSLQCCCMRLLIAFPVKTQLGALMSLVAGCGAHVSGLLDCQRNVAGSLFGVSRSHCGVTLSGLESNNRQIDRTASQKCSMHTCTAGLAGLSLLLCVGWAL
jgi:hypothetical protein